MITLYHKSDLEPGTRNDLLDLSGQLTSAGMRVEVRQLSASRARRSLEWIDVVYIYLGGKVLDQVSTRAIDAAVDAIAHQVRDWAERRRKSGSLKKPHYVAILGEDGRVLRSVMLTHEGDEDRTVADQSKHYPEPPGPEGQRT